MQYTVEQLAAIIHKHGLWSRGEKGGKRADLGGADLEDANLRGANLGRANLGRANLRGAGLENANLGGAKGIYELDMVDARGYRPLAVAYADGWRIASGCRWFTVAEAVEHWTERDHEYAARYLRAIAALPECPKVEG